MSRTIAVIRGDGIGPEIMRATLRVLDELKAGLDYDFVEAGLAAQEQFGELLPAATMEAIAKHRGSLLGDLPDDPQPTQKAFETGILSALDTFDPSRPVFVESESRRIGTLQLPDGLLSSMHRGRRLTLVTPQSLRIDLLKQDYAHFFADTDRFRQRLNQLTAMHGKEVIARWEALAETREWDALVGELLERHYDPTYTRSLGRFADAVSPALRAEVRDVSAGGFATLAREVVSAFETAPAAALP